MKKIELEIIALSHSISQTHSYAVVLGEVNGTKRLPIVIGSSEAQAIAVALEGLKPARPLTHDLMRNFMSAFNIELHEVVINDFQSGIFFSQLICSNDKETVEIDSRTSDALALAVRFNCPIYTFSNILDETGSTPQEENKADFPAQREAIAEAAAPSSSYEDLKQMSVEELNILLNEVLEHEDYMKAIAIRDELKTRK